VQLDLGALENGADRDRELLAASVALIDALAMSFALERSGFGRAAMRANRTIRPELSFEVLASRAFVIVDLIGEVEFRGSAPLPFYVEDEACFFKYIYFPAKLRPIIYQMRSAT
jgi:hypothetical protein